MRYRCNIIMDKQVGVAFIDIGTKEFGAIDLSNVREYWNDYNHLLGKEQGKFFKQIAKGYRFDELYHTVIFTSLDDIKRFITAIAESPNGFVTSFMFELITPIGDEDFYNTLEPIEIPNVCSSAIAQMAGQ